MINLILLILQINDKGEYDSETVIDKIKKIAKTDDYLIKMTSTAKKCESGEINSFILWVSTT